MKKREIGDAGEQSAVEYLKQNKFKILARNYSSKFGEIDIIALETKAARKLQVMYAQMPKVFQNEDVIVFVEVKTRSSVKFGQPSEAVDSSKQKRYFLLADSFLKSIKSSPQFRFDIIEVTSGCINHIRNAF